ncbi:MAG: C40 family peptidase [Hydrogenophaga sp.]
MKKHLSILLLSTLACASVHAAPNPTDSDYATMDNLLADRGLVSTLSTQLNSAKNTVSDRASTIVSSAMGLLGVPYRFGGNDAETGLDCSGLVRLVYEQSFGKILPRRAAEQAAATLEIDRSELKPGDLVFFNTMKRAFSHVGIYVGEGKFIHAPRSGSQVRIEDMRMAYWTTRFNGARRVPVGGN